MTVFEVSARMYHSYHKQLKIIEMDLTENEKHAFEKSVVSIRKTAEEVISMTSK